MKRRGSMVDVGGRVRVVVRPTLPRYRSHVT